MYLFYLPLPSTPHTCPSHLLQIPGNADTEQLLGLLPDRVGHGTFLHPERGGDQKYLDLITDNRIPIGTGRRQDQTICQVRCMERVHLYVDQWAYCLCKSPPFQSQLNESVMFALWAELLLHL